MITADIEDIKYEVETEIDQAFKDFAKNRYKELKLQMAKEREIYQKSKTRLEILEQKARGLTSGKLREEFFEYNVGRQSSAYEDYLTG